MTAETETAPDTGKDQVLPPLVHGETGAVLAVRVFEKKTNPPKRYTEGLLIEDMKNAGKYVEDPTLRSVLKDVSGLGTSATRDSILETLKAHQYLAVKGKLLIPTEKGEELIRWLDTHCAELADVALTARWEAELDAVARRGGGARFESAVATRVREIVTTLRQAAPIPRALPASETKNMNHSQPSAADGARSNPPTPKMLDFAQNIARRLAVELPADVPTSFDACRAFLDAHKDAASGPSDKQLAFARSIAERKGAQIPPDTLKNGKALSAWIDANK